MLLNYGVKTYRWASILRFQRPDLSLVQVARFNFVSIFLGNFLPTNLSSDIVRIYYISRHTAAPGVAISSIFADRIIGNFAVALATVAAFLALRQSGIFEIGSVLSYGIVAFLLLSIAVPLMLQHPLLMNLDKKIIGAVHQPKTLHEAPGHVTTSISLQESNRADFPGAGARISKRDYHCF